MGNAGHRFLPNGDLLVAYPRQNGNRPLLLYKVVGFRDGEKVLVDSWCEEACPHCGCPKERYHAVACPMTKG